MNASMMVSCGVWGNSEEGVVSALVVRCPGVNKGDRAACRGYVDIGSGLYTGPE